MGSLIKQEAFQSPLKKEIANIKKNLGDTNAEKAIKNLQEERQTDFLDKMESEESGTAYVKKTEEAKLKQAFDQKLAAMDYLSGLPHVSYRTNLAEWGMWKLMNIDWPVGWEYHCIPTKQGEMNVYGKRFDTQDGILFVLKSPKGTVFMKAVSCNYDPEIDTHALTQLSVECENTLDSFRGSLSEVREKPKSIILK